MSGVGLRTVNANGELTLSADGITYGFIGKATHTATYQATAQGEHSRSNGFSTYTIVWPGDILAAAIVKDMFATRVSGATRSGDTWTINVINANRNVSPDGQFYQEEATEVYVFGAPLAVSGHGLALFSEQGVLTADLSRPPLTLRGVILMEASVSTWAMPTGVVKPAVLGVPSGFSFSYIGSGTQIYRNGLEYGWGWNPGLTRVERNSFLASRIGPDDGGSGSGGALPTTSGLLLEVSLL